MGLGFPWTVLPWVLIIEKVVLWGRKSARVPTQNDNREPRGLGREETGLGLWPHFTELVFLWISFLEYLD